MVDLVLVLMTCLLMTCLLKRRVTNLNKLSNKKHPQNLGVLFVYKVYLLALLMATIKRDFKRAAVFLVITFLRAALSSA